MSSNQCLSKNMLTVLKVLTVLLVVASGLALPGRPALAQTQDSQSPAIIFTPEVSIPGFFDKDKTVTVDSTLIASYIRAVFVYFIWVVGLLAVFMIVYGGIKWVTAAGNPGRINDARATINNAIIGLIIALTSVLLLNTISPDLRRFKGLTLTTVNRQFLQMVTDIKTESGDLTRCDKTLVAGEPSQVCSGRSPQYNPTYSLQHECKNLNDKVNTFTNNYSSSGIDPFMVKAIIMIESPKENGQVYSGQNSQGGSAYGIGQFLPETLKEVLAKVNVGGLSTGGLPPPCKPDKLYAPDGVHLSDDCKLWLDRQTYIGLGVAGINAQVQMVAYYFGQQMQDSRCVKGDPIFAAAAYNQGLGGARGAFCDPNSYQSKKDLDQVRADALEYIAEFKKQYAAACAAGVTQ